MTALTTSPAAGRPAQGPRRPRGLTWTVLRLHRTALIVWGAFVVLMIGVLVWNEVGTADAALRELDVCARSSRCTIQSAHTYNERMGLVGTAACYSFLTVAAFSGGALFGRELEYGTAQLAWTQSVTPTRWLAAKLAVPALALAAGGTALVLAFRWAWSAHPELVDSDWTNPDVFSARGPALVAYALCALAVGAVTALALRRTLPALGASVAVMVLVNQVMENFRANLWPPLTRTAAAGDTFTLPSGFHVDSGAVTSGGVHKSGAFCFDSDSVTDLKRCLAKEDLVSTYVSYHPASHYVPLHLVETGVVLALAATAALTAFALLSGRTD